MTPPVPINPALNHDNAPPALPIHGVTVTLTSGFHKLKIAKQLKTIHNAIFSIEGSTRHASSAQITVAMMLGIPNKKNIFLSHARQNKLNLEILPKIW